MMRRALLLTATIVVALGTSLTATAAAGTTPTTSSALAGTTQMKLPGGFKHLVVIYLENHSFDNLYGGWGAGQGQPLRRRGPGPPRPTPQGGPDRAAGHRPVPKHP